MEQSLKPTATPVTAFAEKAKSAPRYGGLVPPFCDEKKAWPLLRDTDGNLLNGKDTFKLDVPANTPAREFWSVIEYSMKTKGFVRNAEKVGLSTPNTMDMIVNKEGS